MRIIIFFISILFSYCSIAQTTKIMGAVTDSETGEALPFVSVSLKGGTAGVTTNFDGKFSIEYKQRIDSLIFTYVGYAPKTVAVVIGKFQSIDVKLAPSIYNLKEFVVVPRENPAEVLLKKMLANKFKNNREKFDSYQYEIYNKIEFDINNIDEKTKNRKILKPFEFVFKYADTSTINGKVYLPFFLSEAVSDYYYKKSPKTEKEIIRATKISGVDNPSVQQFMGNMYVNINFYDNYIPIFQKNFVSPIANVGMLFYRYYLVDSAYVGNKWCYKIMFKPRRKQELTFTGNFWVHDSTFALKQIEVRMPDDVNINFISAFTANFEYDIVDGINWMTTKEQVVMDFNPLNDMTTGFFGRRTACYRKFKLDKPIEKEFDKSPTDIVVEKDAMQKDADYWTKSRTDSLSKNESLIYHIVDTIQALPAYKKWFDISQMVITGYYAKGNLEWGPYASLISYNRYEGARIRAGARTSNKFSKKTMLESYCAYGFNDQTFKFGGGLTHIINKSPRQSYGLFYKNDIEQLSRSSNAFRSDFFLTSLLQRFPVTQLTKVEEYKGYYEKEWINGLSNTLTLTHRELRPTLTNVFELNSPDRNLSSISTSEIKLSTRFAYHEKFVTGEFLRYSIGSKYPILQLDYIAGMKGIWNSEFAYNKLTFNCRYWFDVNPFGWSKIIFEVGKIRGTLPYPLLKLHEGNQTYIFDEYAFNLMNFYEFVSDKYASFYYTHHFDGFFLNKVPLFRKLKWREVALFKGVIGSVSNENKAMMDFPKTLSGLTKPYYETGVGIENIFKVIRVDALWRLSYLDKSDIAKFGIRVSLQFTF